MYYKVTSWPRVSYCKTEEEALIIREKQKSRYPDQVCINEYDGIKEEYAV